MINKLFQPKAEVILSLFLSLTLSMAVFSVYSVPLFSVWTLGIILITVLFFIFCGFIDKHHLVGGILYVITALVLFYFFAFLVFSYDWGEGFQQWFLTGAEEYETQFEYQLALLISFVPFFASVVYYFGCVLYRMSFLTLISLIPCALYVKVLSDIDNVYVALIAMLNVAILMTNIRAEKNRGRVVIGRNASVMAAGVFAFVLLVVSALIPKENEARFYDRFEQLFMDSSGRKPIGDYSHFSDFSGNADLYRNFTNRYLYIVYGGNVPYLKRQTFDYYDFENDRWYANNDYSLPSNTLEQWAEHHRKLSLSDLQSAIIAADGYSSGFAEKYGLTRISRYSYINDPIRTMTVEPQHFGAVYYLSPARAVSVVTETNNEPIFITRGGVFRNLTEPHAEGLGYNVWYFDETEARFLWFELGGADFSDEKCAQMLSELTDILSANDDEFAETSRAFYEEHLDAMSYRTEEYEKNTALVSDRVRNLALEVTNGLTYDWEKADALQRYFITNDFVYDMKTIYADTSPEYFLFESKRGSCSDFASAFVLMARSVGLTVRYAEGYNPDITSREGVFAVKDSSSHAYPEVYIQNMGWLVFEPTVPSDYIQIDDLGNNAVQLSIDYGLVFVICVISGIILFAALVLIILLPVIGEKRFTDSLGKVSAGECVILVYKRISGKTAAKTIKKTHTLTPYELMSSLEELTGCDTENFAYTAEKVVYGGKEADESDRKLAIDCYERIKTAVREYTKEENRRKRGRLKKRRDGKEKNE